MPHFNLKHTRRKYTRPTPESTEAISEHTPEASAPAGHISRAPRTALVLCALVLVLAALLAAAEALLPIHGEGEIYEKVVRLHLPANSNSDGDQRIKLRVRDRVVELCGELLSSATGREEALEILSGSLGLIEAAADEVLADEGVDYRSRAELGVEEYPRRNYQSLAFPSGEYMSIRITLGSGEGENWWCVLFPPLCMSAAVKEREQAEDEFLAVGFTPEQYRVITRSDGGRYKIRFRLLEVLGELFG